ncbi:amidohydrolase [Halomarina oriensis]|uniref:Amidohydrolase n=1 Tax=Halomarina oriensis TaxID=671145 RepID=A0A6B0GK20_9EURY|nr:amidohydrolase [Halomarina oriensis]MWG35266.1 amidohydrolase [Halomarina oriensis]
MSVDRDRLVSLRREFHRFPEPAWREFRTTARIVEELHRIGVDDLYVGADLLAGDRMGLPEESEMHRWFDAARREGVDEDTLDRLEGGFTGALAVLHMGEGPTVGLRVDIDGLPRAESEESDHAPASEGFRAETDAMHACGHDAHITFGLGTIEAIKESEFEGTLKVVFQPAEEVVGGGKPVAESGLLDDCDYLLAAHVGLDHPTGEVVAGIDGFLAVHHFAATFTGEPAHAGANPGDGRNANQALAAAVTNLYAIPRHQDGRTTVNAGVVRGGSATNIIPEEASVEGEVRGETTELMEYMRDRAERVIESAATMHACEVDVDTVGGAPSAVSDDEIIDVVESVAGGVEGVDSVLRTDALGGSEDATYLMQRVQDNGGKACYVGIGTDHPGGHHTATFDVDEDSLPIGVSVLSESILRLAAEH